MRYRIYSDGYKLYDSNLKKYKLFNTKLELELNKTGSFTFDIYPTHPNFGHLHKLKSIINVFQDDDLIFRGRVLNDEQGFYNQKQVKCEGELAFLLDSVIRPYGSDNAPWTGTPAEYLQKLLEEHNSQVDDWKQFKLGNVTVTDGDSTNTNNTISRSDSDYKNTWNLITEKLVNSLGGYLWVRHEADGNYLDYLADFDYLSNQKIEFAKNLVDLKKSIKGEDVMTGIIPLGAKSDTTNTRITIAEVNDGKDYIIDEEAAAQLGRIIKPVIFDDVTTPEQLLTKGTAHLANSVKFPASIELTAADLSGIKDVTPFKLGRYVVVKSKHHNLDTFSSDLTFLVRKLSIDPLQPTTNKMTVGTEFKTFTEKTTGIANSQGKIVEQINKTIEEVNANYKADLENVKVELTEENTRIVEESASGIMSQVSTNYYLKSDAETLVESINTQITQTNEKVEIRFNEFSQDINNVEAGADAKFSEISKYIRFIDGNIILGKDGNEITLKIEHNRISFLQSGAEVAYLSDSKLSITDGEFLNALYLGKFAYKPRASGNVSFKKVK